MRSDYEILGISSDADQNEIKKAYFRQIRKHTPEKDPEGFKEIRAAYERLQTEKREDDAPVFPPMKDDTQARFLDQIDKCLKIRNLQLGLETALEAVRLYPDTQIFLYRLSELQRRCGNTGKAVKTAQKLVSLDPGNRWYYRELGMACKGRGYHKKAFEAFYKAHELGCRDAEFMSAFIDTCLENDEDNYAAELMLGIVRSKKEWKPDELSFGNRLFDRLVILYCRYEERYSDIPDIYLDFMEANMKQMAKGREVYDLATLRILAMSSIDNKPVLNRCRKIIAEMIRTVPEREAVSDVERLEADLEVFIFESDDRVDENLQYLYSCLDDEYLEARNYAILDCRLCLIESCTDPQSQKDILMADYPKQYEALEPYLNELMKGSQAVAALKINLQKSYANYCQYCSGGRYFELYPDEKVKVLGQVIATGEKPYTREHKKIGRNDPCPCGSGKKFKQCCMNKGIY